MTGAPRRRSRLGDVIEVPIGAAFGYAQYVARDPNLGPQLRVFPGVFDRRPDIVALAAGKAIYYVHFPLGAAVHRGLVTIVGQAPLPMDKDGRRAEDELYRLMEIWNDTALAARIAKGWTPT
jgi:hypothetical protein